MSDLEQRLADVLAEEALAAPSAVGLATAARSRARQRRRTRLVGAVAAAAVLVGVPTAVAVTRQDSGPPNKDGQVAEDSNPDDWTKHRLHLESWHDVTIQVPDGWSYGPLSAWCAGGGSADQPRISRPGVVESIACTPVSSYGVEFAPAEGHEVQWPVAVQHSDSWPDGAWVGATTVDGVVITVATPDPAFTATVLGTADPIRDFDPNGCAPKADTPSARPAEGWVLVCRYDAGGGLEESELLADKDAAAAVTALEAAPHNNTDCLSLPGESFPVVQMRSGPISAVVDLGGACPAIHGLDGDRLLTSDVLYWALSPGWTGAVDGDVPLPKELRQR